MLVIGKSMFIEGEYEGHRSHIGSKCVITRLCLDAN